MKPFTTFVTFIAVLIGLASPALADTIKLAWDANSEADLAGYYVSYGTQSGSYTKTIDAGKNAALQVTNLVNGTRYYFVVKAYNTSGAFSRASQEISGVAADTPTAPPSAPAGPTPVSGATGVGLTSALSWAASTSASQYDVAFGTTNPPAVVSSNQTSTTYQPAALTTSTTYYWRVVARNSVGSTSGPIWSFTTTSSNRPVPIVAFAFNEGTGTTTADSSGNGRIGALTDATWTSAGKYGGALLFNGNSSRVTVGDAAALHLTTGMTLEAWVSPSTTGEENAQSLIYKGVDNYYLSLLWKSTAPVAGGDIGGGGPQATGPSALPANSWTHVAVTYDGTMVRLFVNATQVASQAASGRFADSSNPLEIGGSLVDGGPFAGLIDDVRIYDIALTPAQLQTDMTTPVGTIIDKQAPTAPTNLAVKADSTSQLALTWTASTDDVGVSGYRIERCTGVGCKNFSAVGTANATTYSDPGLNASTRYTYRLRATDAAGNFSSYSASASGTTPAPALLVPAPSAPSSPNPPSGATGVSVTPTLSWAASTNAKQYSVAFGLSNPPAVVSSSQTSTTYQPATLTASTTYYWQIVASGSGGSTSGPVWSLTTAEPPRPMPVAAYAFDDGKGTTTVDASGNGRTGALSNATWSTAGKFGGALSFNGTSSRVTVADASALHFSTAMTLEAWVNPSTTGMTDAQSLIYKGADNYFLSLLWKSNAPIAGGTINGADSHAGSPNAIPAKTWSHVAVTYDGAMLRLFVNGTQVAGQPASGALAASTSPLEIGGSLKDGGAFTGLIDDVRVYGVALTPAQIQTDMNTPVTSTKSASGSSSSTAMSSGTSSDATSSSGAQPVGTTGSSAARSSAASEPQSLRLMTWNVNGGNSAAGAPNVDAQVTLMVSTGAQVLALQGVTISAAADLSTLYQSKLESATGRTWNSLWIPAPPPLAPAQPDGNLLLTTLPIADSATTVLDSAPMNASLRDAKRSAGWIAVVVNRVTVHIATTQLAVDATQRDTQVNQLNGWIAAVPAPRLIGGDFHMAPTDATHGHMASAFTDVWMAIGPAGNPGLTQNQSPSQSGRFDYWWSELTDQHAAPTGIWVVETSRSSHHAVVVDVNVQ